jgi:hypothetical protein
VVADISNELIYEVLKNLQMRMGNVESVNIELAHGQNALRGHQASIQTDTNNIYSILTRIDQRFDRIERRLELRELAEAQKGFDPNA